jgi:hypothetical protein
VPFQGYLSKAWIGLVPLHLCPAFPEVDDNLERKTIRKSNRFNPNYPLRMAGPSITTRSTDQFPIAIGNVSESKTSIPAGSYVQSLWRIRECGSASITNPQFHVAATNKTGEIFMEDRNQIFTALVKLITAQINSLSKAETNSKHEKYAYL